MVSVKISTLFTWALLLIVGQLLLTQWTIHAAGNRVVIDYISFAGTVVGIILAVLAIVYSFIANASQRTDSEILRGQLTSLNDAIGRANASGDQFSTELARLEDIRRGLSQVVSNSAESLAVSSRVEQYLRNQSSEKEREPTADSADLQRASITAVSRIALRALPEQVVTYFLASDQGERSDRSKLEESLLSRIYKGDNFNAFKSMKRGETLGYNLVFTDLLVFSELSVRHAFRSKLLERAEEILARGDLVEGNPYLDSDGLRASITNVAEDLKSLIQRNA